jgi:hypothetical protein
MSESAKTFHLYEEKAMMLVEQLVEKGIVEMPSDEPILTHVPTGNQFTSVQNLAYYHFGWNTPDTE